MGKAIKVKEQYKNIVIGFNHSALPLGLRNDLHLLYELAKEQGIMYLLEMFEEVPTAAEIETLKTEVFEKKQEEKSKARSSYKSSNKENE
ncbi:MAG: hypothetical protein IPQ08_06355 [Chitinophagaceae bacterium]|nr:hypothetical protein [Chitinophagaceae bacterium]